jgi:acyl-CoA thioesterase-1
MKSPLFLKASCFYRYAPLLLFLSLFACSGSTDEEKRAAEKGDGPGTKGSGKDEAVALFFGNSLTAGKGVEQEEAFPALVEERIDSAGWPIDVVNAGVSGETSSGGESRIDWVLEQQEVDLFVLELGANDGLRGIDPSETKKNLRSIVQKVREEYPDARIVLAGMKVPPNMGREYGERFERIFPELAEEEDIELIPFLLKGVAGKKELNQPDGIHPTAEGHRIVAETVWKVIRDDLKEIAEREGTKVSDRSDDLELDRDRGRKG